MQRFLSLSLLLSVACGSLYAVDRGRDFVFPVFTQPSDNNTVSTLEQEDSLVGSEYVQPSQLSLCGDESIEDEGNTSCSESVTELNENTTPHTLEKHIHAMQQRAQMVAYYLSKAQQNNISDEDKEEIRRQKDNIAVVSLSNSTDVMSHSGMFHFEKYVGSIASAITDIKSRYDSKHLNEAQSVCNEIQHTFVPQIKRMSNISEEQLEDMQKKMVTRK